MNGKIYFNSLTELAEFLKQFSGCTATFEVSKGNQWVLTFLGGY
jgi:hypothetical protein